MQEQQAVAPAEAAARQVADGVAAACSGHQAAMRLRPPGLASWESRPPACEISALGASHMVTQPSALPPPHQRVAAQELSAQQPPLSLPRPPGLPTMQQQVRKRLGVWRKMGAPNHVLRWLREGVRCEWIDAPPPPFHHGVSTFTADDREWVSKERDRCLQTGAWSPASCFDYVSRAFIVEHNGKRRLVLNFKHLNEFERKRTCRFEPLSCLRRTMHEEDWLFSCDLADAYHHVGVYEPDQKYFTFALETDKGIQYFQTSALSFGWTRSPWYFTQILKVAVSYLRNPQHASTPPKMGQRVLTVASPAPIRCLPWLDDFAFFVRGTQLEACSARDWCFEVFDRLGLARAPHKGQPEPSHRLEDHLGFIIDSMKGEFGVTVRRQRKLRKGALDLLHGAAGNARRVRVSELASFSGLAQSTYLALPLVRCWLRALYDNQGQRISGWTRLTRQSLADLRRFVSIPAHQRRRPIWLLPDTAVGHVDAGPLGWGGQLDGCSAVKPAFGFWSRTEADLHITHRELIAVRLWVEWFLERVRGRRVLLYEDNQAVVAMLTTLVSRSPALMAELRKLVELLDTNDIALRALYIRSADNVVADHYSRIARRRDYTISAEVFDLVRSWWGDCEVDAFASGATSLLQRWWAPTPEVGCEAVDAFAQQWAGQRVWAHPPPSLLPQLVQLLSYEPQAEALVATPFWPGETWYSMLLHLSSEHAIFPANSLCRVAYDAPARLETWPVAIFHVKPRA